MTAGWLLAFTGMTKGAAVGHLSGMAKGLSGWQPACSLFVVIPAEIRLQGYRAFGELSRAVVERRLEQAAEESREGRCRGAGTHAGFF